MRIRYKQAYKTAGFKTNRKAEGVLTAAVIAAQAIPNSFVELHDSSGGMAHIVTSMSDMSAQRCHHGYLKSCMLMLLNSLVQMLQTELHTWLCGFGSLWLMISQDFSISHSDKTITATARVVLA